MAVYVLVQILQVVILPLPALVCYVPGVYIWGAGIATLLASAGVLIGALICYFLGRMFGRRVVEWIAGKDNTDKYADYLGKRGKILFVMMQILPFFPDDILCLIAGLTRSGTIIPFSGWGIPVWIAIALACVVLAVLSFKYEDKIKDFLKRLVSKKRKGETSAEEQDGEGQAEEK